jgi:hypothetical protein
MSIFTKLTHHAISLHTAKEKSGHSLCICTELHASGLEVGLNW